MINSVPWGHISHRPVALFIKGRVEVHPLAFKVWVVELEVVVVVWALLVVDVLVWVLDVGVVFCVLGAVLLVEFEELLAFGVTVELVLFDIFVLADVLGVFDVVAVGFEVVLTGFEVVEALFWVDVLLAFVVPTVFVVVWDWIVVPCVSVVVLVLAVATNVPFKILLQISVLLTVHTSHCLVSILNKTLDVFRFELLVSGSHAKQDMLLFV